MLGNGMRLRVLFVLTLLVASLVFLDAAQAPDYSGEAKVVMKLTEMPDMPAMPQAESTNTFGLGATAAFNAPAVPQGTMLQGEVLYSSDPAVKANQTYSLYINYDPQNEPLGFQSGLVDKLKSGAVVGVNDYTVQGNQITVNVGTSANWDEKISVLDMQYTDPNEAKNPFMIDLSGFRSFSVLPVFNSSTTFNPMFNMSDWGGGMRPIINSSAIEFPSMGFPDIFSRFFG
jgi:hypothetical protein